MTERVLEVVLRLRNLRLRDLAELVGRLLLGLLVASDNTLVTLVHDASERDHAAGKMLRRTHNVFRPLTDRVGDRVVDEVMPEPVRHQALALPKTWPLRPPATDSLPRRNYRMVAPKT